MVRILEKLIAGWKTRKEESKLIYKVDILKWENELKPAAEELSDKLHIPFEEALTYLKSIDNKKGSGDFKEKLQNLMDGMKAASETINAAMGVETQVPANKPVQRKRSKNKQGGKKRREEDNDVFDLNVEELEIDIPEIYIPKLPKM